MNKDNNFSEEAFEWLDKNQLSYDIWNKKYRFNNESFNEWLNRVSNNNEDIKQLIINKKFLFGGRILSNRGTQEYHKVTYSNCYVIPPVEDSIEGIYKACSELARTYSYGGGCGIDISNLRPKGADVNNSAKTTSGAVSFMSTFDEVTKVIGQNGRRAALMLSIDINHPDVEEFIDIKANTDKITSANISVRVSDDFMRAVQRKSPNYILSWPCDEYKAGICTNGWEYNKLYEVDGVYYKMIDPVKLFNKLVENNWNYAEPGILYWDRIEQYNLLSNDDNFKYAGVNPCAEEPLPQGGSCLLGSLNLSAFVKNKTFLFADFAKSVQIAVKGLNEVLHEGMSLHPLDIQKESVNDYRQIGLGIMGLADMLIKLGITYGSKEAVDFCDTIGKSLAMNSIIASNELVDSLGKYPNFSYKIAESDFYKNHSILSFSDLQKGLANSQLLTIAPTGTLSTMLNISGGIEPIFAKSYNRTTKSLHGKDVTYKVYPKIIEDYMNENHLDDIKELPEYFVSSEDIPWDNRISMQAVWQKHIDASISSTINLPEEASIEDVYNIYMRAWMEGLKGVTIFRENCKRIAILSKDNKPALTEIIGRQAPKRPKELEADYHQVKVKGEQFIILVGLLEGKPYEVFAFRPLEPVDKPTHKGKIIKAKKKHYTFDSEYIQISDLQLANSNIEERAATLYASMLLRHGVHIDQIIKIAKKVNDNITSFSSAMCRILSKYINTVVSVGELCPDCKSELTREGGCICCKNCGYSKCS